MNKFSFVIIAALLASSCYGQSYDEISPFNERNSQYNERNSQYNERNSQYNQSNSSSGFGDNRRIIRDNEGNATGRAVPRGDGGTNYYDGSGRRGYNPRY